MSRDMAELLGLEFEREKIEFAFGIGGKVKSVQSKVRILIEQKHEKYNIDLPIKIILDDYSFPFLLGRGGFFDEFIVTFNQPMGKVILKKAESKKAY